MAPRPTTSPGLLPTALLLLASVGSVDAQTLPVGLGGIAVGTPWKEVQALPGAVPLEVPITRADHLAAECGYRALRLDTPDSVMLVQADDFVVTAVTETRVLPEGSDIVDIADGLLALHGQPGHATMRDLQGNVTLDRDRVRYVAIGYASPRPVLFTLAAAPLWRAQVRVESEQARWHLNRMLRCARERDAVAPP